MVYKRKKMHYGDTHLKRRWRVRSRKRDLDQIDEDIKPENSDKLINQDVDLDKPGSAQFYCIHCARYFINDQALHEHFRTKVHKRRLKALELEPYTIADSESAAGFGSFKAPQKRKIETQPEKEELAKRRCEDVSEKDRDKAHDNFAVLTPHIDIEERFEDVEALESNIKARGLPIKLDVVEQRWLFYLHLLERKNVLSYTKSEISKEITRLLKDEAKNYEEIRKLKIHARFVKDDYSTLKEYLYGVEESAALKALELPNILHPKTPIGKEEVLETFFDQPKHESKNHLDIGVEKQLIQYTNNSMVFLVNEAATYEYSLLNYFQTKLLDASFIQFSNADFAKSVIVEGCGKNYTDKFDTITLQDGNNHTINRLHLTGGASHYAFMAYFTKYSISPTQFPLKYFTAGRKYEPITKNEPSLFNLIQQSAMETFVSTKDNSEDLNNAYEELVSKVTEIYKELGYHFRLILLPANKIENYESLRLSIQMYSNSLKDYVEVGNVSICDNYLSKRLLFTYNEEKKRKFPKVITGNILNVQKVLACNLENNLGESELLSDLLQQYAPL